jgi:hypothetical protein
MVSKQQGAIKLRKRRGIKKGEGEDRDMKWGQG